jgi:hypothetical protein
VANGPWPEEAYSYLTIPTQHRRDVGALALARLLTAGDCRFLHGLVNTGFVVSD